MSLDFFVSYCHADDKLVRQLVDGLERRRKQVWWDRELSNLTGTMRSWRDEVARNITSARALIVIVTTNSVTRQEVRREVQFAEDQKVPIIALFVGRPEAPPEARGLLMQLIDLQRVKTASSDCIDDAAIEACVQSLVNPTVQVSGRPGDGTPRHDLTVLTAPEVVEIVESMPALPESRALYRAVRQHLVASAAAKNWEEFDASLTDIREFPLMAIVGRLDELSEWRRSVAGYDDVVSTTQTWAELAAALQRLPGRPPALIVKRLQADWWRAVNDSIERLSNAIEFGPRQGSYDHALDAIALLKPDLVDVVRPLIGESDTNLPSGLYAMAGDVLGQVTPSLAAHASGGEPIEEHAWPPGDAELRAADQAGQARRQRAEVVQSWLRFLKGAAGSCGGSGSAPARLERLLHHFFAPAAEHAPASAGLRDAAGAWADGLEALCRGDIPVALGLLEQAGRVFRHAKSHATAVKRWDDARSGSGVGFANATAALQTELVGPAVAEYAAHSRTGAAWRRFQGSLTVHGWVNMLVVDPQAAASAEAPPAPWADVHLGLRARPLANMLAKRDAVNQCLASLMLATSEFAALRSQAAQVGQAITAACSSDPLLATVPVPWLDSLLNGLDAVAAYRTQDERVREHLSAWHFEDAERVLGESVGVPVAALQEPLALSRTVVSALAASRRAGSARDWNAASMALANASGAFDRLRDLVARPDAIAETARPLFDTIAQAKSQEEARIRAALAAESSLAEALDLLERTDYEPATRLLEEMSSRSDIPNALAREITTALHAGTQLLALSRLIEAGNVQSLGIDPETGLPPDDTAVDHERARSQRVIAAAESARKAVDELNEALVAALPKVSGAQS